MSTSVERVRAALLAAGHPDTIDAFPEGTRTAHEAAAAVGCTVAQIAKSIVLRTGEQLILVVASGVNRVDLAKMSTIVGSSVRPADGRWVRDITGFAIGGVPPIGHAAPTRIFVDEDLINLDPVWAAAGSPRHVFKTNTAALVRMTQGVVADVKEC